MAVRVKEGKRKASKRKPAVQNRTPKKEEMPKWVKAFIAALQEAGNISQACRAAGIGRQTAYDLRNSSDEFAALWKDALDEACDALELEARRRAKDGVTKTIFYKGSAIGTEYEYSDTLMIFLLKAHRPEMYRENVRHEHTGKNGGVVEFTITPGTGKDAGDDS